MAKRELPDSPKYYATRYENLKGVDYSCDLTEVSRHRTPTGLNMISDDGGNPVKRRGWRKVADVNCGRILEIIFHEDNKSEYDPEKTYIIGETGIYAIVTKNGVQSRVPMLEKNITSASHFMFDGEVYVFVNGGMYKLEGVTAKGIEDEAYVPENTISKNPDGSGGQSLYSINLLTPKRIFSFLGDDSSKDYFLYPANVRNEDAYKYVVKSSIKVEALTEEGWEEVSFTTPDAVTVKGKDMAGDTKNFEVVTGKITLTKAYAPLTPGQDNVRITFENFDDSESDVEGVSKGQFREERLDLLATESCMTYGHSAVDRVFLVGGRKKNKVYYSGVNQPMYYPDENYVTVGHDSNGITGLHRVSEYLAAIKEDSAIEGTVFLISGVADTTLTGDSYFKVIPTSAGTGAIAPKSFSTLVDEPLFLSRTGVFAIANYYTTTEKVIRNRSYYLDKKLLAEPNLEDACSCTYRRYYILCVNDHCYILDGRSKSQDKNNNTDYLYEGYYWENVPAKVWKVRRDELYFGTIDGYLCKFNTDIDNRTKYCDNGNLVVSDGTMSIEGGVAIPCEWSTLLDDDEKPQYFKTLNKKGTLLTMLPYERTSAKVTLIKDGGNEPIELGTFYADIHSWDVVDFTRFTFNSDDTAQDGFFRKKVKKYKRLRIVVKNDEIYDPFGILGIVKTYSVQNFSKNRG